MPRYLISTDGYASSYSGDTEREAINAYVQEAGYTDLEDAAATLGQTTEEFLADIVVIEQRPRGPIWYPSGYGDEP